MKLIDAYTKLRQLKLPVLQTKDVAAYFDISVNHANKLLSRIAKTKQIIHIRHGIWVFPDIEPLILPCLLTDSISCIYIIANRLVLSWHDFTNTQYYLCCFIS